MKWVKHMTNSRRDPKLLAVKREFGIAGIGMYWVTVEALAEQFEVGGEPELSLDLSSWREITGISPQMMRKWANFGDEMALFSASFSEKTLTISMKKIKEIKDNYTRDCQATSNQEKEEDKEEEISKLKLTCPQQAGGPDCPHQKIIDLYHEILPELRGVRSWDSRRQGYLRSRWKEDESRQNLDWWERYFRYVKKSAFLCGLTDKPFSCDLEWLIRPTNFAKVIEGKYHVQS